MAVDSFLPNGQPQYSPSGADDQAADLTFLASQTWERGTRRVGTNAQRDAFTIAGYATEGFEWYSTTDNISYVRFGSAWRPMLRRRAIALTTARASFPTGFISSFNLGVVAAETTDSTLVATPAAIDNKLIIQQAGYYSITWFGDFGGQVTSNSTLSINRGPSTLVHSTTLGAGLSAVTLSIADVYFNAAEELVFYANKVAGATATFNGKLVVART